MKKVVCFSLVCAALLQASEVDLEPIAVESTKISDVSGEEVKSADLAEALTKKIPSISLVRRSGIANDIILRGQKKDNINILTDGTKVYGACPNRMDPATSHILTNNIESIEITEGPYDVENFGTLSGAVKITTKKPTEEISGEVGLNAGSWGYKKGAATVSGGTKNVKLLISASMESSEQYEDGDGNTLAEQLENATAITPTTQYQDVYKEMDAYEKKTFMGKLYVDITDDQELQLSYTANRSDDVLYPSSKMDALYDDSDIFNAQYTVKNTGSLSKELSIQLYHSEVDHPMTTRYRKSATMMGEMTSALTTEMQGLKLKNALEVSDTATLTVGLDTSNRNWNGSYYKDGVDQNKTSIDDVDTENRALFLELEKSHSKVDVKVGIRYDDTSITPAGTQQANDYTALSANIFATYSANSNLKLFGGIGKATRVPDARELYFTGMMGNEVGTPTLKQTTNYEVDLGMENKYETFNIKTKLFYSKLKDYIYYNASNINMMSQPLNAFENIDATVYGISVSGAYYATDTLYLDFGLAYQRGEKDEALTGQSDKDLAEIPPLKANVALNYDYAMESSAKMEVVAADKWSNYDNDNGEQAIAGYAVANLKANYAFENGFDLAVGIDNVLDKTYAVSNTYNDLTLIAADAGEVMLLNEPGRYLYVNATYKF